MKKLTAEQFKEYAAGPLATDEKVRNWCCVPEDGITPLQCGRKSEREKCAL